MRLLLIRLVVIWLGGNGLWRYTQDFICYRDNGLIHVTSLLHTTTLFLIHSRLRDRETRAGILSNC